MNRGHAQLVREYLARVVFNTLTLKKDLTMRYGGLTQQSGFWDVASKRRNRVTASLPVSLNHATATRGVAVRMSAASVVHAERSACSTTRRGTLFAGKAPAKRA